MSIKEQLQEINMEISKMTTDIEYNIVVNRVKTLGKQYKRYERHKNPEKHEDIWKQYKTMLNTSSHLKTHKCLIIVQETDAYYYAYNMIICLRLCIV